jgi:hypothetical protein
MPIQTEKLDCVFQFPDQTRLQALAHLFRHKYAGRVFWYGVAQFPETPDALPDGAAGASVTFGDGRAGHVAFRDGKTGPGGYFEAAFVGLDNLDLPSSARPKPGNDPSGEPGSGEADNIEFG